MQLMNELLNAGKEGGRLFPGGQIYELIYELYHVRPSLLLPVVVAQLQLKLKSYDEEERLRCVMLLARIFSEKDSQLAVHDRQLWQTFLGR